MSVKLATLVYSIAAIFIGSGACGLDNPKVREHSRHSAIAVSPIDLPGAADGKSKRVDDIDVNVLTATSDFTIFMQPGVPDGLRMRALRKLWATDPVFNEVSPHE